MMGMGMQIIDLRTQADVLLNAISTPEKYRAYLTELKDELAKLAHENTLRKRFIAEQAGKAEKNEADRIANAAAAKKWAIDRTAAETALREAKEIREGVLKAIKLWQPVSLPRAHTPKVAA